MPRSGGGRAGYLPQIPVLKDNEQEAYRIRPAATEDLSLLASLYQRANQRYLVSVVRDEAIWRYELSGRSEENVERIVLKVIETTDGEAVGYLGHPPYNWGPSMVAVAYELKPGISYATVTPSVIRFLKKTGEAYMQADGGKDTFSSFGFWLGAEHPVYQVLKEGLPRIRKPYAWYIRIPDLVGFLNLIKPVLETRLEDSPMSGHTGEFRLTFYRSGLRLSLVPWKSTVRSLATGTSRELRGSRLPRVDFLPVAVWLPIFRRIDGSLSGLLEGDRQRLCAFEHFIP